MKKIVFLFILVLGFSNCQKEADAIIYHSDFVNCSLEVESLDKGKITEPLEGPLYLLNDRPYSGCARADFSAKQQYLIYTFFNGHLTIEEGYHYNGTIARSFAFEKGLRHGLQIMYHPDGSKYLEEQYAYGEPAGLHRRWHPGGALARECYYKKGKLKTDKYFDRTGKLIRQK